MKNIVGVEESLSWYIIVCKTNFVKKAAARLVENGFQIFLPLKKELRIWSDRKKWIEIPAFGPYFFILTTEKKRFQTFEVSGILKYLHFDGKICKMSESELNNIKKIFEFDGEICILQETYTIGDKIEILEGYFKGFQGYLIEKRSLRQLKIVFKEIGYSILVDLRKIGIKKID